MNFPGSVQIASFANREAVPECSPGRKLWVESKP
jgi:hypothetical protein